MSLPTKTRCPGRSLESHPPPPINAPRCIRGTHQTPIADRHATIVVGTVAVHQQRFALVSVRAAHDGDVSVPERRNVRFCVLFLFLTRTVYDPPPTAQSVDGRRKTTTTPRQILQFHLQQRRGERKRGRAVVRHKLISSSRGVSFAP